MKTNSRDAKYFSFLSDQCIKTERRWRMFFDPFFLLYAYPRGKSQMSLSSLLHFDFFSFSFFLFFYFPCSSKFSVYLLLTHLFDIHGDTMKFSCRFEVFTNQHFTCFYRHHEDEMSHIFSFDAIPFDYHMWICRYHESLNIWGILVEQFG